MKKCLCKFFFLKDKLFDFREWQGQPAITLSNPLPVTVSVNLGVMLFTGADWVSMVSRQSRVVCHVPIVTRGRRKLPLTRPRFALSHSLNYTGGRCWFSRLEGEARDVL